MKEICNDLMAEYEALDSIVADLDETQYETETQFWKWRVRDEISHLAYIDGKARLAATDPDGFALHVEEVFKDPDAFGADQLARGRNMTWTGLLEWWRWERTALLTALGSFDPEFRLPWYGPPMSARSFAIARIMETWAHGQDIVDALEIRRPLSDCLYHIADLGVRTFGWSFSNRRMNVPDTRVRVELISPPGSLLTWGPEDAENIVRGTVEEFCLVVTRRRHIADTGIATEGHVASQWMAIAQVFAGPPEEGPEPGHFQKHGTGR